MTRITAAKETNVVVAIALFSSPVFPGTQWHDGARHAQLLFSSVI